MSAPEGDGRDGARRAVRRPVVAGVPRARRRPRRSGATFWAR